MAKRLKVGDVFEVPGDRWFGYIQYIGFHSMYGEAIVVSSEKSASKIRPEPSIFSDGYVTFYPVSLASRKALVNLAANLPARTMPTYFRLVHRVSPAGKVENWAVEHEGGTWIKHSLTPDERAIPIAQVLNHEALLMRIDRGWRLDSPRSPHASPTASSFPSDALNVLHYLYFRDVSVGRDVAAQLRAKGQMVEDRMDSDGVNWLVQVNQRGASVGSVETTRANLEKVAEGNGGEYDGWVAEPPR